MSELLSAAVLTVNAAGVCKKLTLNGVEVENVARADVIVLPDEIMQLIVIINIGSIATIRERPPQ